MLDQVARFAVQPTMQARDKPTAQQQAPDERPQSGVHEPVESKQRLLEPEMLVEKILRQAIQQKAWQEDEQQFREPMEPAARFASDAPLGGRIDGGVEIVVQSASGGSHVVGFGLLVRG